MPAAAGRRTGSIKKAAVGLRRLWFGAVVAFVFATSPFLAAEDVPIVAAASDLQFALLDPVLMHVVQRNRLEPGSEDGIHPMPENPG